jgi:hypothetical protein
MEVSGLSDTPVAAPQRKRDVLNTQHRLSELFQLNRNLTLTPTAEPRLHSYIAHISHFTDCSTLQKEKHSNKNKIYSCANCTCIYACDKTPPPPPPPPPIKLPSDSSDCPYRHLDIHMHVSAATAGEKVMNCHYKEHLLPLFNGHCIFNKKQMSCSTYE